MQLDKRKQRELTKRQRDAERASKATMKLKLRDVGPPDDLEIEAADIRKRRRITIAEASGDGGDAAAAHDDIIDRPVFPPADITDRLVPAFTGAPHCLVTCDTQVLQGCPRNAVVAAKLCGLAFSITASCAGELAERDSELGGAFLMLWSFLHDFGALLGVHAPPLDDLFAAVRVGEASSALVNIHIGLLRFLQAEAEGAHALTSHAVREPAYRRCACVCGLGGARW